MLPSTIHFPNGSQIPPASTNAEGIYPANANKGESFNRLFVVRMKFWTKFSEFWTPSATYDEPVMKKPEKSEGC